MKLSSRWTPAREHLPLLSLGLLLASLAEPSQAINFNPIPSANLDLASSGRVGLVGDFSGISLYEFEGQNQNGFSTNGTQSILARLPNGAFTNLAAADGNIKAMCSFIQKNGVDAGVIVGGAFTSLQGIESPGAGLFNTNTSTITALPGLSGTVNALLCDPSANAVYVGGNFKGANSTNAIMWVGGGGGWTNLPFRGFNGPVSSITKASNGNVIFGGNFTGLGNATSPRNPDQQIVNIAGANITSGSSTTTAGLSDPRNIVCRNSSTDGTGTTWLLADKTPGFWKATFGFGFTPTKLRLFNTHLDGRGTKTWRYTAQPINGIMNFTYVDPVTGQNATCTSECPLSDNSSIPFQDFHFVNNVGMNAFQIDVSAFYGSGGGLNGIELFQDDIFAYAINEFNEPTCAGIQTASNATSTGPWIVTPSGASSSQFLTANVTSATNDQVVFLPDIKQSGNYSVNIYTPGCKQDNTCETRGQINITGTMSSTAASPFTATNFQTNEFDKYDPIFFGYVDAVSSSFRPSVTLSPVAGQNIPNLSVVAQRVGFTLIASSSTDGLKNIFEYNPSEATINSAEFVNSTFDKAGTSIQKGTGITTLATSGSTTFVGGDFSATGFQNIFEITDTGARPLSGGSLNGAVATSFLNGTSLYVGGNFTNTNTSSIAGLNHVALYDISKNTWTALGAGVDGMVADIVPLSINISTNTPETVITLTGSFGKINAFGSNESSTVSGFAVWVPSRSNWLQNIDSATVSLNGQLTAFVDLPTGGSLFAGQISSSQFNTNGAVELISTSALSTFPVRIQPQQGSNATTSVAKRATTSTQNVTGVAAGLFDVSRGRNLTILGGHFTATNSNGSAINNVVIINNANSDSVAGVGGEISSDATILALAIQDDILWAGGKLTGTVNSGAVNGLFSYNVVSSSFGPQPPALSGGESTVNTIAVRPKTAEIYVGGNFESAGALTCPGVCMFATAAAQWDRPGTNLEGVANTMFWASTTMLVAGGEFKLNGANTSLALYDAKSQNWTNAPLASAIPGPITAMTAVNNDSSQLWVAGTQTNGSAFVLNYDGANWNSVGSSLKDGTDIRGLKVLPLLKDHASSNLLTTKQVLLLTGSLNLPGFGNASAVIFNGTDFQPYALTNSASSTGGSLSQFFSSEAVQFGTKGRRLAVGLIVLIALACSLGLIFLLVVAGVIAERVRRKREGYLPAPTSTHDRNYGTSRIPPEQLFGSLGQGRSGVEKASTRI